MSSTKFTNQLTIGQAYENLAIKLLGLKNYETSQLKGNFKKWDIHDFDKEKKFEVKADLQVDIYKNLYIEFESYGKPSGYSVTEADYYIYFARLKSTLVVDGREVFDDEHQPDYLRFYAIPIKALRRIIKKNMFEPTRGGDFNRSVGYKVPERLLNKWLHVKIPKPTI